MLFRSLYYRLYFTITLCNFYLGQEGNAADQEIRNAEVRFIRAYNYALVMDLYGNAAFTETVSAEMALGYSRSQFFEYVERELKECADLMAEPGKNTYGRADRVAAWNLLARIYLNAEVYTGTPRWDDAMTYAEKVINNGYYHLNTTGATNPVIIFCNVAASAGLVVKNLSISCLRKRIHLPQLLSAPEGA